MHRVLDRSLWPLEWFACADELDIAQRGDEHRDEALTDVVSAAEVCQPGVEILAVVEADGEGPAVCDFSCPSDYSRRPSHKPTARE
jgi:hypothetical protein